MASKRPFTIRNPRGCLLVPYIDNQGCNPPCQLQLVLWFSVLAHSSVLILSYTHPETVDHWPCLPLERVLPWLTCSTTSSSEIEPPPSPLKPPPCIHSLPHPTLPTPYTAGATPAQAALLLWAVWWVTSIWTLCEKSTLQFGWAISAMVCLDSAKSLTLNQAPPDSCTAISKTLHAEAKTN